MSPDVQPLGAFLVLLAAIYVLFLGPLWFAVRRQWVHRSTAAFWVFISPWVFGFLLFTVGPMAYSLVLSFFDWNLIDPPSFTGLDNYTEAASDPLVAKAVQVTLTYAALSVPLQVALSLGVALLMNVRVRGIHVFRTIWYLPSLVTGVAQVVLFLWVFNPGYGLLNGVLRVFGIEGPAWFADPGWALPAVVIMSLWTVGGNMVIYLAGLQDVPTELYEAAHLDGAGAVRRFWSITLPQISPVIFFNVITGLIGAMQTFTQGYVVTQAGGGPSHSLLFFVLYLYQNAFEYFRMGYASALAWILLVMILLLTALIFRGSAFWVYYESTRPKEARFARAK
ncbi:sugar ABC transporter permease [Jiangella aurantiaca]|uniref:Sugar ABC transporter permease n=2 Tax=Jiangella aurantiaca TaxID=2530373 RepID=A0A4R5AME9_9ACTN|nr:sugar ABC transporter permease [Jiangella aurantiaca]